MQESLFSDQSEAGPIVDDDHDPYDELQDAARRLSAEYVIDEEAALQAVLAYGSESGARRILRQRWWNGDVEMREQREAA